MVTPDYDHIVGHRPTPWWHRLVSI